MNCKFKDTLLFKRHICNTFAITGGIQAKLTECWREGGGKRFLNFAFRGRRFSVTKCISLTRLKIQKNQPKWTFNSISVEVVSKSIFTQAIKIASCNISRPAKGISKLKLLGNVSRRPGESKYNGWRKEKRVFGGRDYCPPITYES